MLKLLPSPAGSTASWVDLVSGQTASFQPPASQTSQRVRAPRPAAAKHSSPGSPPAFRPSIRLQQQIQAAKEQDEQQQQHQQHCARLSCKPGINREAEKDRLAAVVRACVAHYCCCIQCEYSFVKLSAILNHLSSHSHIAAPLAVEGIQMYCQQLLPALPCCRAVCSGQGRSSSAATVQPDSYKCSSSQAAKQQHAAPVQEQLIDQVRDHAVSHIFISIFLSISNSA
jgi:hypothetical protein